MLVAFFFTLHFSVWRAVRRIIDLGPESPWIHGPKETVLKQGHPSFSFPDNLVIPLSKLSITQSRISETRQTKLSCRACKVTGSFEKRAFDHRLRITYLVP